MRSVFAFVGVLVAQWISFAAQFDVIIQNGRIIDGSGAPAAHGDVGVRDGKVVAIGRLNPREASRIIDASGMVVAPGFIDVHTHAEDVVEMPAAENFLRMGVTTLMLGNCGSSELDVDKLMRDVEAKKVAPNVATLIGHNSVRRKAMGGSFDRIPTAEEMKRMKELVREAMKAGAYGFSTGLIYLPGTFSKTEEIVELAKVASDYGGIYVSHMRDEGLEIEDALNELFRIAREADMRAHVSHIKLSGKSAWGRAAKILETIEQARGEGLDITQDQYTYTASSTGISQLIPDWAREGGKFEQRLKDPETKARIKADMLKGLKERGFEDFSYAVIANYPVQKASNGGRAKTDTSFNGLNIMEAARKRFASNSLDDQVEMILQAHSATGVFHSMDEEDAQAFLRHPNTMLASDSSVRKFGQGVPHPRGYGNNARAIHRYVNELGVLRLEECVRRMSSLPASAFRIAKRGQIQEGFWADILIFDPKQVRDRATFTQPHQYAAGFEYVFVNGVAVIAKGETTDERAGKGLRFGRVE